MDFNPSSGEVLAVMREMWPREYQIAVLAAVTQRQADYIGDLEAAIQARLPADPVPDNT